MTKRLMALIERRMPALAPGHLTVLDGLRAVSVLLILVTHLLPLGPGHWQVHYLTGNAGMSLFFAMSGFLIATILWERPQVGPFLLRRCARIVPLFWLYGAICTLLITWRPDSLLAILTFTLNYRDAQLFPQIGHLWSLCVEMHFYIGIALAVGLFGRKGFWLVPLAALVVLALRIDGDVVISIQTHLRVDEILTGALVGLWWVNRGHPALQRLEPWLLMLLPLVAVLWLIGCHGKVLPLALARPWTGALTVAGILLLQPRTMLHRWLSARPLRWIAEISYALYIWHPLFAFGIFDSVNRVLKYLVLRPITLALTFGTSILSTFWFERSFTRLARRK